MVVCCFFVLNGNIVSLLYDNDNKKMSVGTIKACRLRYRMKITHKQGPMKRLYIIFMAVVLAPLACAQVNVHIDGTAANAAGKTVELYCYDDVLSGSEVLLDAAQVGQDGRFSLGCYVTYPRTVFMQVEQYSQTFHVEAGSRYEVYIPEFDWDIDERQNIHLAPVALPIEFVGLPSDELNMRIAAFDTVVDSFVTANRVWFDAKFHPQRRYFDTLETFLHSRFGNLDPDADGFFGRYAAYSLAEMRLAMHFDSRKRLVAKYIADHPVRYYDEPYMSLFMALYAGAISKGTARVPQGRLVAWVAEGDYDRYIDSIGLDPMLRNEQVRELAVLEALKESYYDRAYDRQGVRDMVRMLGSRTRFKEHREMADRLLTLFARGERGSEVAPFLLPDVDRRPVSLDAFRGKWVYLSFVRVGDPYSLREIETLAFFRDSIYAHNNDVEFVTIACDREFQKMYHLLKNNRRGKRYNWTWLHFDGNYRLLEHYGVVSFPTFLLINPDGHLHYTVTPAPASGILLHGPWEKKTDAGDDTGRPFFMR